MSAHQELRGPSGNQDAQCSCGWNGGLVTLWRDHAAEVIEAAERDRDVLQAEVDDLRGRLGLLHEYAAAGVLPPGYENAVERDRDRALDALRSICAPTISLYDKEKRAEAIERARALLAVQEQARTPQEEGHP